MWGSGGRHADKTSRTIRVPSVAGLRGLLRRCHHRHRIQSSACRHFYDMAAQRDCAGGVAPRTTPPLVDFDSSPCCRRTSNVVATFQQNVPLLVMFYNSPAMQFSSSSGLLRFAPSPADHRASTVCAAWHCTFCSLPLALTRSACLVAVSLFTVMGWAPQSGSPGDSGFSRT